MTNKDLTPVEAAAVEKTVRTATTLLGKIFGPAMEEFGLMIGDDMKVRRLKNQIKNFQKIEKIVEKEKITMQEVNLKALVPYLNNVSLEEDESLQDMWANLMVNYLDSSRNLTTIVYPNILAQLSSDEVKILNALREGRGSLAAIYPNWPKIQDEQPILNLTRLGLVEHIFQIEQKRRNLISGDRLEFQNKPTRRYKLTKFGLAFLVACER